MNLKTNILLIIFVFSTVYCFTAGISPGSYPGEIYTNSIQFLDEQNIMQYGLGYSPDSGKHFVQIGTTTDLGFSANLYGTCFPGIVYLHDTVVDCLFKSQNYGSTFSLVNIDISDIDGIEPGGQQNQLFLYNNTPSECYLYESNDSGTSYETISSFPQISLKHIAFDRETDGLYLLGYNHADSMLYLFKSSNNGISFDDHELDSQLQTPYSEYMFMKLLPANEGNIFIFQHNLAVTPRQYQLFASNDNGESCELVWTYNPLMQEYVDMTRKGNSQNDFIEQSDLWLMAYNVLEYSISNGNVLNFDQIANYSFQYPYQNPVYLVPTPDIDTLAAEAGSVTIHVRSNANWQIDCTDDWVTGFSQTAGNGHQEVTMNYLSNVTYEDRTCEIVFTSSTAPDTTITITQRGAVTNIDLVYESNIVTSVYPNPFSSNLSIEYSLPKDSGINIAVYNIIGQKVCTLINCKQNKGNQKYVWDGLSDNGKLASNGLYFIKLTDDTGITQIKKVLLVK